VEVIHERHRLYFPKIRFFLVRREGFAFLSQSKKERRKESACRQAGTRNNASSSSDLFFNGFSRKSLPLLAIPSRVARSGYVSVGCL